MRNEQENDDEKDEEDAGERSRAAASAAAPASPAAQCDRSRCVSDAQCAAADASRPTPAAENALSAAMAVICKGGREFNESERARAG